MRGGKSIVLTFLLSKSVKKGKRGGELSMREERKGRGEGDEFKISLIIVGFRRSCFSPYVQDDLSGRKKRKEEGREGPIRGEGKGERGEKDLRLRERTLPTPCSDSGRLELKREEKKRQLLEKKGGGPAAAWFYVRYVKRRKGGERGGKNDEIERGGKEKRRRGKEGKFEIGHTMVRGYGHMAVPSCRRSMRRG